MLQMLTKRYCRGAALMVLLSALLFLFPVRVAVAAPITDYQQRLNDSIASLEELVGLNNENTSDFGSRVAQTTEVIRTALPAHETVEFGEDRCNVDNLSLHKALDELKQASVADQPEKIAQLLETLQAIEARVQERQNPGSTLLDKTQAKAKLESILARPDYVAGAKGSNALTRVLRDFLKWLASLFPKPDPIDSGRASWFSLIAQVVVILIALAVIVYVVSVLLKRFKRPGKLKVRKKRGPRIVLGERLEPEETATNLLSEAEALARRGELRAAIRKAYIALLVELGDRKLISLAQHKTNRDYLNSLRTVPPLHSRMRGLTESFERHWYGFAEATQNDWQDFRAGYLAALHTKN